MRGKKVLVPVDFSERGNAALEYAAALAGDEGELIVAHVRELSQSYHRGDETFLGSSENARVKLREMLEAICPQSSQAKVQHRLLDGEPVETLLHCAEFERVDLIVISTHGRSGLTRMLLGSVAAEISQQARCPVLMLKVNS